MPDFNPLIEEALLEAREIHFRRTRTRLLKAEHLMAIMLQTGRLKDLARLAQFVEVGKFESDELEGILTRHGLLQQWSEFMRTE